MEPKPYTQSVIAKLMGLKEMPCQQPVKSRKRVLSENYLRKTASIGLREKTPIKERHSFSSATEKEQEFKAVLGLSEMLKKENGKLQQSKLFTEDLSSDKEALFRYLLQKDDSFNEPYLKFPIISNINQSKIDKTTARRNILRSRQKLDNGFATEPYGNYSLPTKIVILKSKPVKVKRDFKSSLSLSLQSENSKQKFSSPKENPWEKEIINLKSRPRNNVSSWNVSNSGDRVKETSPEVNTSSNYSKFAKEAKERILDRWKMIKDAQEVGTVSCNATLNEVLSVPDLEVGPKTLNESKCRLDELAPKAGNMELDRHLEENCKSVNSGSNASTLNASKLVSDFTVIDVVGDSEIENVGLASGARTKQQSMPLASDVFVKDGYSHCFFDCSAGEESQIRPHEYVVDYSNCMSSGEAYQPSPNSVLEPHFKEDVSPVSHCYETDSTDLQGLWMELQLLKSDSEETISEGTGMNISSDGDATEKSFLSSSKTTKLTKFLRESESKDFSYILDILEESGLHSGTTFVNFASWHYPETLLAPSIFESLEKKYNDNTPWNKTERRLLFDRVNERLMEILKPWLDHGHVYAKPLRKFFCNALNRDLIEEELWNLLLSEEKEAKKGLSEKAVGNESWVKFSDEVVAIVIDIENFLFDELVEELV